MRIDRVPFPPPNSLSLYLPQDVAIAPNLYIYLKADFARSNDRSEMITHSKEEHKKGEGDDERPRRVGFDIKDSRRGRE